MFSLILTLFVLSTALVTYHYVLYPALVIFLARRRGPLPAPVDPGRWPKLVVVIAAYNEERVIADKLENTLGLDYPSGQLSVIVAAHGSSDGTAEIARRFSARGVQVLHDPVRRGKTAALNRAVEAATASGAEVIVFSDANNHFNADALKALVRHFTDPKVGGVCGLKQIYASADRESAVGDSLYWRYESAIKIAESRLGSITTGDGEIFAVRRALYRTLDESLINDDTAITFELIQAGYRVLYEPAARSYEHASIRIEEDFNVKVRMISGGFQSVSRYRSFLLPPRHAFAWAFFSHKILRWTAIELLLVMLLSSLWLATQSPLFQLALGLQLAFYLLAWAGWQRMRRPGHSGELPKALYVPFYFCAMNIAALFGLYRYLSKTTVWKKAER